MIEHILKSVEAQAAAEAAPTIVDPIQQTLVALLQGHLNNPNLNRSEVRDVMARLRRPATTGLIRRFKAAYAAFSNGQGAETLVASLRELLDGAGAALPESTPQTALVQREDLRLVCFDHLVS